MKTYIGALPMAERHGITGMAKRSIIQALSNKRRGKGYVPKAFENFPEPDVRIITSDTGTVIYGWKVDD